MSDAFDGAGKPYRGPSFKAGILIVLALIVASFIIWNLASWGAWNCSTSTGRRVR